MTTPKSLLGCPANQLIPLTGPDSRLLADLHFLEMGLDTKQRVVGNLPLELASDPLLAMLNKYLVAHGEVNLSLALLLWVAHLTKGVPGLVALWTLTLRRMSDEIDHSRPLVLGDWTRAFSLGEPNEAFVSSVISYNKNLEPNL